MKGTSRAVAKRDKIGLQCAKKLEDAANSLSTYLQVCRECNDGSGDERTSIADGRHILIGNLMEYATFLDSKHGAKT